jgi:hypothetical protein
MVSAMNRANGNRQQHPKAEELFDRLIAIYDPRPIRDPALPELIGDIGLQERIQLIASANPNSIFKNYKLVDVLWSQEPNAYFSSDPNPAARWQSSAEPKRGILANTTLETYTQNTNPCLGCHV